MPFAPRPPITPEPRSCTRPSQHCLYKAITQQHSPDLARDEHTRFLADPTPATELPISLRLVDSMSLQLGKYRLITYAPIYCIVRLLRARVFLERLSFSVAQTIHVYLLKDDGRRVCYSSCVRSIAWFWKSLRSPHNLRKDADRLGNWVI
jgi:hypothetical protein